MQTVFQYLAEQPVLVLFGLIGIGMYLGHFRIKGIGLGAAAVLFLAIGISAWGTSVGVEDMAASIPHTFGKLGLALFAFAIGINSGRYLRSPGWRRRSSLPARQDCGYGRGHYRRDFRRRHY